MRPEDIRLSLGVGAFLRGHVGLQEAADLAGTTASAITEELARLGPDPRLTRGEPDVLLSVVVPVLNEEENVGGLAERLKRALDPIGTYEIIFVDDGSTDNTAETLLKLHATDRRVKVVALSRNFGHQNALSAGIDRARGRAVVLMDGDGQDPPEVVPELVARWRDGNQVVYGVRARRGEAWPKRLSYRLFYRLLARFAELRIPLDAGDFCLMDEQVADVIRSLPESSQFLRGLRSWAGFRQVGVPYDRPIREHGKTAYSFAKLVSLALNGLLSFSSFPLRVASALGFLTSAIGLVYLGIGIGFRVFRGHVPAGWTSIVAVVVLLGGAQLVVIGVVGEYLSRVYAETKRRPRYVVRETHWDA